MLVCLLRAVSPEDTERLSPSTLTPGHLPSNNGVFLTSFIMQNISFTPEAQSKKDSSGITVLFELLCITTDGGSIAPCAG